MPQEWPLAAGLEDLPHHLERLVESVVLEDRQHRAELLGRKRMLLADVPFLDEQERLVAGNREPGVPGDDRRRRARSCRACGGPRASQYAACSSAFSRSLTRYPPSVCSCVQERVVDRRVDEQVAVGRAARSVVVGLADARVARGLGDVRGLVDRPSSRCRRRRRTPVCQSCRPTRTIAGPPVAIVRSQMLINSLRERNARTLDALQQILRRAEPRQRRTHHAHGLVRRLPAAGMRREDHRVLALDRVDGDADRRHVRARHRNQRRR